MKMQAVHVQIKIPKALIYQNLLHCLRRSLQNDTTEKKQAALKPLIKETLSKLSESADFFLPEDKVTNL